MDAPVADLLHRFPSLRSSLDWSLREDGASEGVAAALDSTYPDFWPPLSSSSSSRNPIPRYSYAPSRRSSSSEPESTLRRAHRLRASRLLSLSASKFGPRLAPHPAQSVERLLAMCFQAGVTAEHLHEALDECGHSEAGRAVRAYATMPWTMAAWCVDAPLPVGALPLPAGVPRPLLRGPLRRPMARDVIGAGGPERFGALVAQLDRCSMLHNPADYHAFAAALARLGAHPVPVIEGLAEWDRGRACFSEKHAALAFVTHWLHLAGASFEVLQSALAMMPIPIARQPALAAALGLAGEGREPRARIEREIELDSRLDAPMARDHLDRAAIARLVATLQASTRMLPATVPATPWREAPPSDWTYAAMFLPREDGASGFLAVEIAEAKAKCPEHPARVLFEEYWLPHRTATLAALRRALHGVGHDDLLATTNTASETRSGDTTAPAVLPAPADPPAAPIAPNPPPPPSIRCTVCESPILRGALYRSVCPHYVFCEACFLSFMQSGSRSNSCSICNSCLIGYGNAPMLRLE